MKHPAQPMTQQSEAEQIPEEVAAFCVEADTLVREGKPDEAQRRLNFALDALRNLVRPRAQARVLEAFAHLHRSVGRMAEAEASLRAALACFLKLGDRASEARLLGELASTRISQGDLEDGGFWLQSSFEVLRELDDKPGLAEIHRNIAALHLRKGEVKTAEDEAELAINLFRVLGDKQGEARTQGMLAQVLMRRSAYAAAHAAAERARQLFEQEGHKPGVSSARMIVAAILRHEGRLREAERLLTELLADKQAQQDRAGEAGILNTLGMVVMDLNDNRLQVAERHFLRSIEVFSAINDSQNAALSRVNLADLYGTLGRPQDAEAVLRDAIKLQQSTGARESEMRTVRSLGHVLAVQGRLDDAAQAYRDALDFARGHGGGALVHEFLAPWAELQLARGRLPEVRETVRRVEKNHPPTRPLRVKFLLPILARVALSVRDIDSARAAVSEAELLLSEEAEEARPGLRGAIDEVLAAIRVAEKAEKWPLYNGYRPEEFAPGLRQPLLAELKAARPEDYEELSPELLAAMEG
ncbi:MAG: tetratricopeptide repeat protein [Planctomycetes bacterium]|nr:tetratricopeptide repeat protein [Planctomycetota bacterium]